MTAKGRIRLGRGAFLRLGDPEAVKLLFDKVNATIGLLPVKRGTKNAYIVTRDAHRQGRYVNAYRLTTEFEIRLDETVIFRKDRYGRNTCARPANGAGFS